MAIDNRDFIFGSGKSDYAPTARRRPVLRALLWLLVLGGVGYGGVRAYQTFYKTMSSEEASSTSLSVSMTATPDSLQSFVATAPAKPAAPKPAAPIAATPVPATPAPVVPAPVVSVTPAAPLTPAVPATPATATTPAPAKTPVTPAAPATAAKAAPITLVPETPAPAATPAAQTAPVATPSTPATTTAKPAAPLSELAKQWAEVDRLEKAKDADGLLAQLKKLAAEHPTDANGGNALYRLGAVYYGRGKAAEAFGFWSKAARELPETAGGKLSALVLAGNAWNQQGVDKPNPNPARWEEIRDLYSIAIGRGDTPHLSPELRTQVINRLNFLNKTIIFSPFSCRNSDEHTVKQRETLETIARKYGVHSDSIAIMNGLQGQYLREGMRLKILNMTSDRTEIVVDKKNLTLTLFLNGIWIKQYSVCIGPDRKTPTGTFTVTQKVVNPDWTDPKTRQIIPFGHPENILGTRWMRLTNDGIGIHGTTMPETIPGRVSNGCIRMHNADVEELYAFTLRLSKVTIIE